MQIIMEQPLINFCSNISRWTAYEWYLLKALLVCWLTVLIWSKLFSTIGATHSMNFKTLVIYIIMFFIIFIFLFSSSFGNEKWAIWLDANFVRFCRFSCSLRTQTHAYRFAIALFSFIVCLNHLQQNSAPHGRDSAEESNGFISALLVFIFCQKLNQLCLSQQKLNWIHFFIAKFYPALSLCLCVRMKMKCAIYI